MSVWRYTAVPAGASRPTQGVISAPSLDDARDALRSAGMKPVRIREVPEGQGRSHHRPVLSTAGLRQMLDAYLRRRRLTAKAEAFDAIATLLRSGITPLRALRVLAGSHAKTSGVALLARTLADRVAEGVPVSEAARLSPSWFDDAECAVLAAGERAGELDESLSRLAERQARAHDLGSRLTAVMLYPALVTVIGLAVSAYLSVRTLPQLTGVLTDSGVEIPRLTSAVMEAGQVLAANLLLVTVLAFAGVIGTAAVLFSRQIRVPGWLLRRVPAVFRRVKTAESFLSLAELTESGLTLVESVRVVAPTVSGPLGSALGRAWIAVADLIEQGVAFENALDDEVWFTEEHRELLAAGVQAGELPSTLHRLGERERRSAHRLIDRAASLMEPAAIVLLTFFVGTIVLAAVLPIVKLQEIIG